MLFHYFRIIDDYCIGLLIVFKMSFSQLSPRTMRINTYTLYKSESHETHDSHH